MLVYSDIFVIERESVYTNNNFRRISYENKTQTVSFFTNGFSYTTFASAAEVEGVDSSINPITLANENEVMPRYTQSFGPFCSYATDIGRHCYVMTLDEDAYLTATIYTETFFQLRIHKENVNGELVYSTGFNPMGTANNPIRTALRLRGSDSVQKFPAGKYMIEVMFQPTQKWYSFGLVASSVTYFTNIVLISKISYFFLHFFLFLIILLWKYLLTHLYQCYILLLYSIILRIMYYLFQYVFLRYYLF